MAAGSGRFAKKKSHIQELERLQRKEEREIRNRELSDEEDDDEIPVLVPIPEQTNKKSRFATMVVATFSLLTVIALAAAMIMTPYSAWMRRLLFRLLTSTSEDVENHRKYDSVDYTPELNEWIQGGEKEAS